MTAPAPRLLSPGPACSGAGEGDDLPDPRTATGSCVRCQRMLDLASVKVDGAWYCRASCAAGVAGETSHVSELALFNRPRRHFRRRLPKELRGRESA